MKNNKEATLQSIFSASFAGYKAQHGISMDQYKAAHAIMHCGTGYLGSEAWYCNNDEHIEEQHHSCRHRSCPRCNGAQTNEWLEKTKARLLPCDHYHVVFTLPHELNPIWHYNRRWCGDCLHKASSETLRQLLKDDRYLGADVGILTSLHTWGRTLSFHPHIHALVTGGGMKSGAWESVKKDFLLPVGVIKAKFRGKWLSWLNEAYDAGDIQLPPDWTESDWKKALRLIARKDWNIRIQGAYCHGDGVAAYLSRYVRGGPIKDHSVTDVGSNRVGFKYLDYRDAKTKIMRLSTENFISRVLWHVPVKGQHSVRYYGLYVPGAYRKRAVVRTLLEAGPEKRPSEKRTKDRFCPICGVILVRQKRVRSEITYIRCHHVQQGVRADATRQGSPPSIGSERIFLSEQAQLN